MPKACRHRVAGVDLDLKKTLATANSVHDMVRRFLAGTSPRVGMVEHR
jgi:hypothetical protein